MYENHPRRSGTGMMQYNDCFVRNGIPEGKIGFRLGDLLNTGERGAVIADNWGLSGVGSSVTAEWLEPCLETYRLAILFNDVVDLPKFALGPAAIDSLNLEASKIIRRSSMAIDGMLMFENLAETEVQTYLALDAREPGAWSIWHEPHFDPVRSHLRTPNTAVRVALQQALLVPGREVPFEDLIEFRNRNIKQLRDLRFHLDEIAIKIARSGPDPALFRLELEKLEIAIVEYTEVARKPNWKKAIGGLSISIDWAAAIRNSVFGFGAASAFSIPLAQAAAVVGSGIIASIEMSSTRGLKGASLNSPFEYIARVHRELT